MIHNKFRYLLTLVALFAMTAGAWAQATFGVKEITPDMVPSTWNNDNSAVTADDLANWGFVEITEAEALTWTGAPQQGTVRLIYSISSGCNSVDWEEGNQNGSSGSFTHRVIYNLVCNPQYNSGFDVYITTEAPLTVTWNAATNTGTFAMPAFDVVLTPIYAKTAAFATTGTEPDVKTLLPEAAEGVIAGTDAPLIAEGTGIVAFAGTSTEVRQGTVMYAVTPATVTDASELIPSDWKNTVPTAKNIADNGAELKVWYYIQGADAPQGVAATLDNTFNNSDIASLTVSVRSNKFDLTLKAANANTIDATQASKGTVSVKVGDAAAVDKTSAITDEGKLTAIKMGSEVKMTAKQGYKFRKVEVKKAGPGPLTYATKEGAVTRIKFNYSGSVYYADFTYSNGSFTRTGGSGNYIFNGSWTMEEENGVLTMTANFYQMSVQFIYFVCTFYVDTNEYSASSTGNWNYSFSGIEVNGNDITDQLTKVK